MATHISKIKTTRAEEKSLRALSPFEIKNQLIALAEEHAQKSAAALLNAGRGNPNWIATVPREAFFLAGQFGLEECRRNMDVDGILAGIVQEKEGVSKRFEAFIDKNKSLPGAVLLQQAFRYGVDKHKFDPDAWIREWIEAVIGFNYPVPDRMLSQIEKVVHDYLLQEMCGTTESKGNYDLFAVEGGTAAMCYIFDSLMQNYLVKKGDKIALLTPTFTPYVEIPELDRYAFDVVYIQASSTGDKGFHTWQYPDAELDKLKDPAVKIAFVVNPSNPPSFAMGSATLDHIAAIVKNDNPGLMIITDDVYGTFVNNFRSLMAVLPFNTITVYSFSKYFGCTGWRLGAIAIHEENIFDKKIAALSAAQKKDLNKRYGTISLTPESIKFIDRMVADSRQVALNHTAGLSLPQQFQMMLFAAFCLLDQKNEYKALTQSIIQQRLKLLWEGLEVDIPDDPTRAGYYSEIDVLVAAKFYYGEEFAKWLVENFDPVDVLFRLAEKTSVVLLNGGGFAGPEWSIRVSLANLDTDDYLAVGKNIRAILMEYVTAWKEGAQK
ncbi:aspartate 4-decarboxylase [Flavihumibacter petaseus]|uniref:Putative aspartate 4-decarboxylase n=1 Tax=Flavihumibacter petaseus NBRC 106054 TaxID=1220578 RepID=A0A0E9N3W8_9BACT|nr:aspartate 4-decarboxylase [Flavihumibacter petaseus]GAO44060.1 putative aspartate 4-decarboxylase [Flavihumibacter petaseus NBRC 106054]